MKLTGEVTRGMATVRVWSKGRRIMYTQEVVALEVVKGSCRCDTCFMRLNQVLERLQTNKTEHSVKEVGGSVYVVFLRTEGNTPYETIANAIGEKVESGAFDWDW